MQATPFVVFAIALLFDFQIAPLFSSLSAPPDGHKGTFQRLLPQRGVRCSVLLGIWRLDASMFINICPFVISLFYITTAIKVWNQHDINTANNHKNAHLRFNHF